MLECGFCAVEGSYDPGYGIDDQDAEERHKKAVLDLVRPPQNERIYEIDHADEQR